MSRKLAKIVHETNMFGTQISLQMADTNYELDANAEVNWCAQNKSLKHNFYWLRAPTLDVTALQAAAQVLSQVEHPFEFRVWHKAGVLSDASLKFSDASDAALAAWSLNGAWCKWDSGQEADFVQSQKKVKPLKVKVDSQGRVTIKGKIQVQQVGVQDPD